MATFDVGETIILSIEVKNDAGTLVDPATSMKIVIEQIRPYLVVVASVAMTKDSTGKYHYDFQTASVQAGKYNAIYTATDGTRITIESEQFDLE